jgi:hypothetical protein
MAEVTERELRVAQQYLEELYSKLESDIFPQICNNEEEDGLESNFSEEEFKFAKNYLNGVYESKKIRYFRCIS